MNLHKPRIFERQSTTNFYVHDLVLKVIEGLKVEIYKPLDY